jgi:hypothetical protein
MHTHSFLLQSKWNGLTTLEWWKYKNECSYNQNILIIYNDFTSLSACFVVGSVWFNCIPKPWGGLSNQQTEI